MKIPNPNLYIPIEFTDSKGLTHHAESWASLIVKVKRYREQNGFPVGNPEQEVLSQACEKYPDRCVETKNNKLPVLADDLNLRLLSWLVSVFERKGKVFVSETEARRRAEICAACPRQKNWREKCGSCASRADQLKDKILDGKPHKFSDELMGCFALSEDPRVSVWIEQPAVGDEKLPKECWRK